VTVIDFVTLTRRSWRTLLVAVVLGLAVMAGLSATTTPTYEAQSAGFIAGGNNGVIAGSDEAVARANAYIPLISSQPVLDKIRHNPKVDSGGQPLAGRLSAAVVPGSTLIQVYASAASPAAAVALSNGALEALAAVIDDIETKGSPGNAPSIRVVPLENAGEPTFPSSPNWKRNLVTGAAAGLVAGYLWVFLRRALDVRLRADDDVNQLIGTGLLGRVPKLGKRRGGSRGIAPMDVLAQEAIRQVRTGLRFSSVDQEVQSIAVTSANQSEGKSTISAALAKAMAESGRPTLLVDGDLRRPSVTSMLGIDSAVGLSEVLSSQVAVADAIQGTSWPGLFALPSGRIPPNPSEMLGSETMRGLVKELSRDYCVIVDAPPLLPVTDAALISVIVDGVVLIAASGRTRKPELQAARRILEQVNARVLGVVLNLVSPREGESGYYYRKSRSYYTRQPDLTKPKGRRRAPSGGGARRDREAVS
jgi:capsular exopolysaccharide synthesis family protein